MALESHRLLLGGPLGYRFEDPEVDAHMRKIEELFQLDHEQLDALRHAWLSDEEYDRVQAEIAEMGRPDYDY